ncbi:MAG: multiheme c-type cytochrome [Pseudomonadota bacterium]
MKAGLILSLLLLLSAVGEEPTPTQAPLDSRGWHARSAPLDPSAVLAAGEPQPITLPPLVTDHIQRRTVLIYISPNCPHCVVVEPELAALARRVGDVADVLTVFSGLAKRSAVETFVAEQQLTSPWVLDEGHVFADAAGLDSTPSVLVVDPPEKAGTHKVLVRNAFLPYVHGADAILEMRIRGATEPVLARGGWLGALTCAACHPEESRSWSGSLHSVAYYHLLNAGGLDDPACLACHTTNPQAGPWVPGKEGQEPGFRAGDHRSPFANVTCEACHGPAGPHDGDGGSPTASCAACHAPDHVPFQQAQALPLLDHFAGNVTSDAAMQSWRQLVALGEEERPLATMAAGPSVGADACGKCHKPQHRQWRSTPHAKAMSFLPEGKREEVSCVVCHATPQDSSIPAGGVEAFRTDEGVGCELCHGPGAAHAQDPAANPLWSLHTRAPACFVQGICERCHNEIRDEDFDLEEALPLVAH